MEADSVTFLTILGHPIGHSVSPTMQAAAIREAGLRAVYGAVDVPPERLGDAIKGLRALGFRGANVTIPHKEAVVAALDDLTDEARRIGAVNTIVRDADRLIGDNTDGEGWRRSLEEECASSVAGLRAVIAGAGGAARAIADALLAAGCERVTLLNRHEARAAALAAHLEVWHGRGRVFTHALDASQLADCDLFVNTTPVGMEGHADGQIPVAPSSLREDLIVSDIVYRPTWTPLLIAARETGCRIHGGLGMLVYQGALAFERWFGVAANTDSMRAAAVEALK